MLKEDQLMLLKLHQEKLEVMEKELKDYKEKFKIQQEEFIKFVNEKIDTDEFIDCNTDDFTIDANNMLCRIGQIRALVKAKQYDINSMKEFIEEEKNKQ